MLYDEFVQNSKEEYDYAYKLVFDDLFKGDRRARTEEKVWEIFKKHSTDHWFYTFFHESIHGSLMPAMKWFLKSSFHVKFSLPPDRVLLLVVAIVRVIKMNKDGGKLDKLLFGKLASGTISSPPSELCGVLGELIFGSDVNALRQVESLPMCRAALAPLTFFDRSFFDFFIGFESIYANAQSSPQVGYRDVSLIYLMMMQILALMGSESAAAEEAFDISEAHVQESIVHFVTHQDQALRKFCDDYFTKPQSFIPFNLAELGFISFRIVFLACSPVCWLVTVTVTMPIKKSPVNGLFL